MLIDYRRGEILLFSHIALIASIRVMMVVLSTTTITMRKEVEIIVDTHDQKSIERLRSICSTYYSDQSRKPHRLETINLFCSALLSSRSSTVLLRQISSSTHGIHIPTITGTGKAIPREQISLQTQSRSPKSIKLLSSLSLLAFRSGDLIDVE